MAGFDAGFKELEDFVGSMLQSLGGAEQKKLQRHIAQTMRRSNQRRIGRQQNPDGSRYARRKPPQDDDQQSRPQLKFLYPGGGFGDPRIVVMKSWKGMGDDKFIGFDRRAGAIRTFFRSKIIRHLDPDPRDGQGRDGKLQRKRTIRAKAMFRKIKTGRYLRAGQGRDEAWIGFVGLLGEIAGVHQFGGRDRPNPYAKEVDYPQRELLGLTAKDRDELLDAVIDHLLG
ncbi:MAG: phage virion morphogenesis protein [Sphingobium sp.]|nr:phage virion morphogenesis protein [Sphingobium sp.]